MTDTWVFAHYRHAAAHLVAGEALGVEVTFIPTDSRFTEHIKDATPLETAVIVLAGYLETKDDPGWEALTDLDADALGRCRASGIDLDHAASLAGRLIAGAHVRILEVAQQLADTAAAS